jgi:uncharacterized Fe-S cluster protein YjdI
VKDLTKKYKTKELTVIWKPNLCIHSQICCKGLPAVFNPKIKPWIKPENSTTIELMKLIDKCPTQALSYTLNEQTTKTEITEMNQVTIQVTINGPLLVDGKFTLIDKDGKETLREGTSALCRCGASKNKPFCDGEHNSVNFDN